MTSFQDCSVGVAVESTYGTGVTVTRWLEFTEETLDYNKNVVQGEGLRVGSRVARSGRRVVTTSEAGGDITVECLSKGMGVFWQGVMGAGTSTLVSGATYQQNFTLSDSPPSLTIQKGLPRTDGTVDPYTYVGSQCDSFELSFGNAEIATLTSTWNSKDVVTGTAYAAPSYSTGANLFHFANGSLSTGTFTAPTTTALASAATPVANVRGGTLQVNHNPANDRYNFGGGGKKVKPAVGLREITGTLEVEYDSATFRDAVLADTAMSLVLTYTGGALSTGTETLQLALPELKLDGKLPTSNAGELITVSLEFTVLDNLTAAQPIWVVARTSDAAL